MDAGRDCQGGNPLQAPPCPACGLQVCILYIGLMIGVRSIANDPPRAPSSEIATGSTDPLRALATAPVTAVAYCLHYNAARCVSQRRVFVRPSNALCRVAHRYYYELRDRSMRRFSLATLVSFGLVCVLYLMTAIGGYYLFGFATKGDVLLNFPSKCVLSHGAAAMGRWGRRRQVLDALASPLALLWLQ